MPKFRGSVYRQVVPGVITASISSEGEVLLDRIMAEWDEFRRGLPRAQQRSIYTFAYWLVRHSGLIEPAEGDG